MATRSTIAVQHEDGTVSSVYCHYDGYLEHNGKCLIENYNSLELAETLVACGNMSMLDKRITPATSTHTFGNAEKGVSVFYARDRGEELTVNKFWNFEMYRLTNGLQEYNYIFCDGEWQVWCNKDLRSVAELLEEIAETEE